LPARLEQARFLVIAEARQALEQQLGRKVVESTGSRIPHRHGWRRPAPRPFHPKREPEAVAALKKDFAKTVGQA
jgi:hypothetical protein